MLLSIEDCTSKSFATDYRAGKSNDLINNGTLISFSSICGVFI